MSNVALKKSIEEPISNASETTNGITTGYAGMSGFAHFYWPGNLTVDLGDSYKLYCIRFLLWDGLGTNKTGQRDSRIYKYRILTSKDHHSWDVIHDTSGDGYNGWQVFIFQEKIDARYIRINGLWNSANSEFHVVEVEAHDDIPEELEADITLKRLISGEQVTTEIGDGLPLESKVRTLINNLDTLIRSTNVLNPAPFNDLIAQLRMQVKDIGAIERSIDSIRNEIMNPIRKELATSNKLGKYSKYGFLVGIIGFILAMVSIIQNILRK
jgi:hypothetical protein